MAEELRLFFLRHGLADRSAYEGDDDDLRPLTDEGRRRMHEQAAFIAGLSPGIDVAITSPLTRAVETAQIVVDRLGIEDRLEVDPRLGPGFDLPTLASILADLADEHRHVMLVGHEPGFSMVVGELIGHGNVAMKKGGLARVDLQPHRRLRGRLVWLLPPRTMLSGGLAPDDEGPGRD